MLHAAAFD